MTRSRGNPWQITGLILWRGGLVFTAAYAFYWGAWQFIRQFDWPWQLTTGAAITMAGAGLILASVVIERIEASRQEGSLLDD